MGGVVGGGGGGGGEWGGVGGGGGGRKRGGEGRGRGEGLLRGVRGGLLRGWGVVNAQSGARALWRTGGAAERRAARTPTGQILHIHLNLTDDHPWAQACVILEARAIEG